MKVTVQCDCGMTNKIVLNDHVDIIEDAVYCWCGAPLAIPLPNTANVMWEPAFKLSGPTLDPITGKMQWSMMIAALVNYRLVSVGRVFGDTEDMAKAVAIHVCKIHNRCVDAPRERDETVDAEPGG